MKFLGLTRHPVRFLALLLTTLLLVSLGAGWQPSTANTINRATVTQILDSNQVYIQNRQARVNAVATRGQRVLTRKARAELQFNTGAIGRLAQNSILTVGQCARLRRGVLLVNGQVNGCSSSVVAGVRGTTYIMEVDAAENTQITVLEGEVAIAPVSAEMLPDDMPDDTPEPDASPAPMPDATQQPPRLPIASAIGLRHPPLLAHASLTDVGILPPQSAAPVPVAFWPTDPLEMAQYPYPGGQNLPDPTLPRPDRPQNPEDLLQDEKDPVLQVEPEKQDQVVVLQAGETIEVQQDGTIGLVRKLTQAEFIRLLKGELFRGFPTSLPGMSKIRQSFSRLFPSVPFPIPLPSIPIRLPF